MEPGLPDPFDGERRAPTPSIELVVYQLGEMRTVVERGFDKLDQRFDNINDRLTSQEQWQAVTKAAFSDLRQSVKDHAADILALRRWQAEEQGGRAAISRTAATLAALIGAACAVATLLATGQLG